VLARRWASGFREDTRGVFTLTFDADATVARVAVSTKRFGFGFSRPETVLGYCGGLQVESGLLPACPDGQILASGSGSRTVRLWNRQTGSCLKVLHEHTSWLTSVIFSSNGQVVVSGTDDRLGS
jgi:WD40 repeat protein